jgi:FkbM family methyltransferase
MSSPATGTERPCVVITTYARPDSLALLLDDLEREWPHEELDVRIYDDATPNPDPALEARICERGWTLLRARMNHGKRRWWEWWNEILGDLRGTDARLFHLLQDDMRLCRRFFERSAEAWAAIDDPHKGSLYLHVTPERGTLGSRCWGSEGARRVGGVVHSGWVDLAAVLCDRSLFEALGWRLEPVEEDRWREQELMSSGVGQQLSVRARSLGLGLYRVDRSLATHDGGPSLLNAKARRRWTMQTVGFVDGDDAAKGCLRPRPHVFASLATIPDRERGLRQVLDALLPQVDAIGVYLNEYPRMPHYLEHENIVIARSQDSGVRGDAGKFFWSGRTTGYQLVCDDDIAYPDDYVERLAAGIERHRRRAVVGFHGRVLSREVVDYHRSRRLFHFTRSLGADTPVHVLGTGVAGYHSSTIAVWPEDFVQPNMADIWLALTGQRQKVGFVCLRHEDGWLRELAGFRESSIYARARARRPRTGQPFSPETLAVREHSPWTLVEIPDEHARTAARRLRPRPGRPAHVRSSTEKRSSLRSLVRVRVAGPERTGTLALPAHDHITSVVRRTGTYYERDLLDAIREQVRGGVFVDIGAHYGNHTLYFSLECDAERVVAVEPHPDAFAGLQETLAANDLGSRVVTHRLAIHPVWREVMLTVPPLRSRARRANSGCTTIAQADGHPQAAAAPLDEVLEGLEGITLVKVDAVGLSVEVLASGQGMLLRERPLVAAEARVPREYNAVRALLARHGYRELGRYCWTPTWLWAPSERVAPSRLRPGRRPAPRSASRARHR